MPALKRLSLKNSHVCLEVTHWLEVEELPTVRFETPAEVFDVLIQCGLSRSAVGIAIRAFWAWAVSQISLADCRRAVWKRSMPADARPQNPKIESNWGSRPVSPALGGMKL